MKIKTLTTTVAMLAGSILLVGGLSGCALLYPNWNTTANPGQSQSASSSSSSSPTASESVSPTPSPTATKARSKAQLSILDSGVDAQAGIVYAVAEVTNVVEDGGTCTLTFIGAGKTKTISGKAESNATDTQCHPLQLPLAGLPKGAGLITITYDSATHLGTSAAIAVTIP